MAIIIIFQLRINVYLTFFFYFLIFFSIRCDLEALAEMEEPKFYDVYIVDKTASTSASLTMYPVPIRVLNYGGNTGQTPNINGQRSDEADDQYHRRLFLCE